jgi:hypothetical protein
VRPDPIGDGPDQFFISVDPSAGELVRSNAPSCASQHSRDPFGYVLNIDRLQFRFSPAEHWIDRQDPEQPRDCRHKDIIGPEHNRRANEDCARKALSDGNLTCAARGDVRHR